MTKKEFALNAIAPYFKDPSLCGIQNGTCLYLTKDDKMCVAGKYMLPEILKDSNKLGSICYIFLKYDFDQTKIFKPEVVDILNAKEWENLQRIHDGIAEGVGLYFRIRDLGLFTMEELQEASQKL